MNYEASVHYLLSLGRELSAPTQAAAAKFDLENITALAERLGRPDRAYPSAHIAGTNGKGSTAAFLESILRRVGLRTGLYTSPHLERINERIRIAGEEISDAAFEVGLGGRLDSTNVIIPAVTLITPIDFDHENFLGHSIREIAGEKAGILKPGVPVVVSPERPEARDVILGRAADLGCPVVETETAFRVEHQVSEDGCERALVTELASSRQFHIAPHLPGRFQLQNALTAAAAARVLAAYGFRIPDEAVSEGIASAEWPGRLEKVHSQPDVYLDGAHNPAAARELAAFWSQNFADRKIRLVYGALREKAVDEIAGLLFPRAAEVVFTEPRTTRAISAAQLAEITAHHAQRFAIVPDAEEAVERVFTEAGPRDAIFVTGSLYLVGQVRHFWKNRTGVLAP